MGQSQSSRQPSREGSRSSSYKRPSSSKEKGERRSSVSPLRTFLWRSCAKEAEAPNECSAGQGRNEKSAIWADGSKKNCLFLQLEPTCFYAVTSFLFVNELPTLMAVCRRFRELIDSDECVLRCQGLLVDGFLWFDRMESPPTPALLSLGLRLEKQAPHLHTIAVSTKKTRKPPPQLQQFLSTNAGICRSLWVYSSPGGFGTYLEDVISQMHELREVGVVGEDMDSLFVRRFLKQLFSNPQSHVKTLWLGVGDHSVECLRAAVLKTASMSINTQSVFATLEELHLNLGGYSCGLLALTGFLELLQKQLRDTCTVYLEGTLNISSFPSLAGTTDDTDTCLMGSVEEAYDRVVRYNSAGPTVDGGTDFCSQMDQDVLLNSFRSSQRARAHSVGGNLELLERQHQEEQQRTSSPPARFRRHSFSLEGFTLRKSMGGARRALSGMSEGLIALKLDRLIEFCCSLRRCEGEFEAAGERRLHRLLAATFSSLPKDALDAYNKRFSTSHMSLPSLVVELPRHSGFPVPLRLLSRFKSVLSAFLAEFSVMLLQLPTGPPFDGSSTTSNNDAGVKEVVKFLGETNCAKIAGIQLDFQRLPIFATADATVSGGREAAGAQLAATSAVAGGDRQGAAAMKSEARGAAAPALVGGGEAAALGGRGVGVGAAGSALRAAAGSVALEHLGGALIEGLQSLGLQRGSWWILRLKASPMTAARGDVVEFMQALISQQGEPGVIEWQLLREGGGSKRQQHIFTSSGAPALGNLDLLLRQRNYKCTERFCEWFDTVTYVKKESAADNLTTD